jgi:hypothetical protein
LIAKKVAQEMDELRADNDELAAENERIRAELEELCRDIDRKEYAASEFKQIVKECALRPTSSTSSNTHYTQNNLLQYLSPDPIPFSRLPEELAKALRPQDITAEPQTFTERVRKCLLQDDDGKSKVVCTDSARGKFAYKDEKEDRLLHDPMLEGLRENLATAAKDAGLQRKSCGGLDPTSENYNTVRRVKTNLRFGDGFARRVARRTYRGGLPRGSARLVFKDSAPIRPS